VGDNAGKLHKFIHIFVSGTPQEITGGGLSSGWPQQIDPSTTALLTSPVYDFSSGNVFVGSSGGKLYHIPGGGASTGGGSQNIVGSATLATTSNSTGITAPPLVDSTAGRVYVFVQTDNSSSCNNGSAHQCFSATYQLTNTFSGSSAGTERTLGGSSVSGGSPDVIAFAGSFDNNYFNSGNATGSLYVCGPDTGGTIPTLYQLPLTTNSLGAATTGPALAAGATNCSPVTEFFDGTNDWAFLSVQADNKTAAPVTCPSGMGCIMSFNVTSASGFGSSKSTSSTALEAGGTSGIVIDNNVTTPSGSQVYFSPLANQSCAGNGSTGSGTGGCATQASQSGL